MPSLVERFGTFAAYADATVDQLLVASRAPIKRLGAVTLDHTVFLNRGDRFEPMPLPAEAQLAPAFYAGVADFDGDGMEDVFIAQNFSPTSLGSPRYDAGRSLLMRGDGNGGLAPLSGMSSGLIMYGDQRGAGYSDFNGDGRLDLAVGQNGYTTRLFENQGARPGIRVRLAGPAMNPDGVGAQVRLVYGERMGPVRQVQSGSGFWSQNGAVQVLGTSGEADGVWVRWPGGRISRTALPPGAREITIPFQ